MHILSVFIPFIVMSQKRKSDISNEDVKKARGEDEVDIPVGLQELIPHAEKSSDAKRNEKIKKLDKMVKNIMENRNENNT